MSTSRAISNRAIPIVMDAGALSDASAKAASHDHADDPSQPLAGPAPVFVMVGDTPIDEAEIAREMQFHRADNPHDARQAAATTLVIRELVRRDWRRRWHGRALAVVRPGSTDEVAAVVRACAAARRRAIVPQGGNTGLAWARARRQRHAGGAEPARMNAVRAHRQGQPDHHRGGRLHAAERAGGGRRRACCSR
jgi:hypothetical protein